MTDTPKKIGPFERGSFRDLRMWRRILLLPGLPAMVILGVCVNIFILGDGRSPSPSAGQALLCGLLVGTWPPMVCLGLLRWVENRMKENALKQGRLARIDVSYAFLHQLLALPDHMEIVFAGERGFANRDRQLLSIIASSKFLPEASDKIAPLKLEYRAMELWEMGEDAISRLRVTNIEGMDT